MFVRVKRRKLRQKSNGQPEYSLHVVLVENNRERGRPRQRVVKYLGAITERAFHEPDLRKIFFDRLIRALHDCNIQPKLRAALQVRLIRLFLHTDFVKP